MRIPILALLLFLGLTAHGQPYSCFRPDLKQYYTNSNHYLRGMRIDSVRTFPDHTIYYPFHTKRGRYNTGSVSMELDTAGGSWLGRMIVAKNDGTFLFDNIWGDTIRLETQAEPGESWMFYEDTSDIYYLANVMSKSTKVIYGVVDSVKKIRITAYSRATSMAVSDPADGLFLTISKNFGFYDVFDLYLFPHRYVSSSAPYTASRQDTMDYFLNIVGHNNSLIRKYTFP